MSQLNALLGLISVLSQDNVVGREYTYVNATARNRRAFVRAVHGVFVHPGNGEAGTENAGDATVARCGFEQVDVVHLFGLVCPDFPEELVSREFFEDVRALFGSLAFRAEGGGNTTSAGGGRADEAKARAAREVNLRILLDQLQVMRAEPRNQLRYIDLSFTEAAARRGGLGERVTLPAFLACLLLHSDELALGLLKRVPIDGYADRLEACPALWSDGLISPHSALGDAADAAVEAPG
eukprot:g14197.t1